MRGGTQSQVPNVFFKSGKLSSSSFQIEEESKQDDSFNNKKRTQSEIKEVDKRLKLDTQQKHLKKYRNKKSDVTTDIGKLEERINENDCRRQHIKKKLTTNETDKLRKRIKNKAYMKEYREKNNIKKQLTTNEADKLRERIKKKAYMKEYRRKNKIKKNLTTNEEDKLRNTIQS